MTVDDQLEAVVGLAGEVLGPDLVAVYLYGSAMLGGLQPRSDVDLLVLGARCLTAAEKRTVVDRLLEISLDPPPGWTRHDGERMLGASTGSRLGRLRERHLQDLPRAGHITAREARVAERIE